MKQMEMFGEVKKYYGGSLVHGKRKTLRPLCTHRPVHLVLKAEKRIILFNNREFINQKVRGYASRFGIRIYDISIQRDHIHFNIRIHDRGQYKKFIRSLTGLLARKFGKGMWKVLPFTRVTEWGRGFTSVKTYIDQNEKEVWGVVKYKKRGKCRYQ